MDAYKKFTHKTPHLKGKQHQLDPNIDLKQLVHHAAVQYVDRDADGDVDVYDNPKKKTPDENPIGVDFGNLSKKLIAKQKGEIKHTKRGMAYEEVEEKRYCPLCDKKETRSECSYGEKAWDKVSVKDEEYSMVRSELSTMMSAIKRLQKKVGKGEGNLEAWVQSKITKAADYIDTAADYVGGGEMEEACWVGYKQKGLKKKGKRMVPNCVPTNEAKTLGFEIKKSSGAGALTPDAAKQLGDKAVSLQKKKAAAVSLPKLKENRGIVEDILNDIQEASKSGDASLHDWFAKSKSSDEKPGWVQLGGKYAGKPCAKQPGQTTKPKCGSSKMAAEMSPEEEERAAERKRREDPNPDRKGKAINVATEEYVEEDACKTKVKSRYKVWPSAYASGALVKCRKVGAANWGNKTKNEDVTIEDANGTTFAEVIDVIKPDPIKGFKQQVNETTRLQSETGNIIAVILNWRGKAYSIRMFFPQSGMPSRKDVTTEIQKVYPGAQVLQYNVSTLQPGMPLIQVVNSKSKNYSLGEENIEEVAAWQRKEGKSQSGGLNEKGRKSYERENPGSNLQRPQPEGGSRRDSFCARMKGMKRKLTSAKTANDPDSRINKSLRAWNC